MGTLYVIGIFLFGLACVLTHYKLQAIIEGRRSTSNPTTAKAVLIRITMMEEMKTELGKDWKKYFNFVNIAVYIGLSLVWPISIGILIGIRIFAKHQK